MELKDAVESTKLEGVQLIRNASFSKLAKLASRPDGNSLVYSNHSIDRELPDSCCVIVKEPQVNQIMEWFQGGILSADDPEEAFYKIHISLSEHPNFKNMEKSQIDPNATIHETAWIDREGVVIEKGVSIGPNCTILSGSVLREGVTVRSGVTIGETCLEVKVIDGIRQTIPHTGKVVIGENSDIHTGTTISKGLFPNDITEIGQQVIVGDICHIAHGVKVADKCTIAAGSIVCGSVEIEDNCWIGPNSTLSNRIRVGMGSRVNLGATVIQNLKERSAVSGFYADNHIKMLSLKAKLLAKKRPKN